MSDLQRYIAQRKAADPAFAEGVEEGYTNWRLKIGSSLSYSTFTAFVLEYAESRRGEGETASTAVYQMLVKSIRKH